MPIATLLGLALVLPTADARPRCYTPLKLGKPAVQAIAYAGESDRPASIGYVDSAIYPIRVHYNREEDADRAETVVIPAAERAWETEVDTMQWPAPPSDDGLGGSDSFDYYLTNEDTYGGAWTWGPYRDVVSGDGFYSIASFVALDQRGITDADMPVFVAHEFNHALQYGIDGAEVTGFVWESTAEAMEPLVVPESDIYTYDIEDFQSLPFESILFDSYSREVSNENADSYYEYGGSISGLYLEQAYGSFDGTTLRDLWLAMAQGDDSDEPDYVDALGVIGGDAAPTYQDVYLGLAEYRMFVSGDDDGAHYPAGADWPRQAKVATEDTLTLSSIDGTTVTPSDEPYDLGASYWEITVDGGADGSLDLTLTGDASVEWGVVATAWLDGQPARVVKARGADGEEVTASLDLTGATKVMVAVANLGEADLDAEARHGRAGFTLAFARGDGTPDPGGDDTAAPPPDDTGSDTPGEDPGEEDEAKACGCASTGTPGIGAGVLLAAVAFARRRRRA